MPIYASDFLTRQTLGDVIGSVFRTMDIDCSHCNMLSMCRASVGALLDLQATCFNFGRYMVFGLWFVLWGTDFALFCTLIIMWGTYVLSDTLSWWIGGMMDEQVSRCIRNM